MVLIIISSHAVRLKPIITPDYYISLEGQITESSAPEPTAEPNVMEVGDEASGC